mmetsp:Transcript_11741/g.37505  ORF Transcript_11741/g.37505 Transcript_11741/m.37505 type:complete len:383 (+) Transcript_11741:5120-6268(+)
MHPAGKRQRAQRLLHRSGRLIVLEHHRLFGGAAVLERQRVAPRDRVAVGRLKRHHRVLIHAHDQARRRATRVGRFQLRRHVRGIGKHVQLFASLSRRRAQLDALAALEGERNRAGQGGPRHGRGPRLLIARYLGHVHVVRRAGMPNGDILQLQCPIRHDRVHFTSWHQVHQRPLRHCVRQRVAESSSIVLVIQQDVRRRIGGEGTDVEALVAHRDGMAHGELVLLPHVYRRHQLRRIRSQVEPTTQQTRRSLRVGTRAEGVPIEGGGRGEHRSARGTSGELEGQRLIHRGVQDLRRCRLQRAGRCASWAGSSPRVVDEERQQHSTNTVGRHCWKPAGRLCGKLGQREVHNMARWLPRCAQLSHIIPAAQHCHFLHRPDAQQN